VNALRASLLEPHARGSVSNAQAACLARTVATREIVTSKDNASARLRETSACSTHLDDAFAVRMKQRDAAGAEAAIVRIEQGTLSDGAARDYLTDGDAAWRAVGTATLHRRDDGHSRRAALLDPSPQVRRSAVLACRRAKDANDLPGLFETARLDPELLLRNHAVRAMSEILRSNTKSAHVARHANRLRDLWTTSDDALQHDIEVAWSLSPVFENGGREALITLIAAGFDASVIGAAAVVLRMPKADPELAGLARERISRAITESAREERLEAIRGAQLSGGMLDALRVATTEDDARVRVAALARLVESKPDHERAIRELEGLAAPNTQHGPTVTSAARLALAQAGDLRIQAWLEEDLAAPSIERRIQAASALGALGRPARAVMLLADPDASIRTRVACAILSATAH
jgi:hypothetical protein